MGKARRCQQAAKMADHDDIYSRLKKLSEDRTKSTASGFVSLLKRLRRVLWQDSALLRLHHPDHFLFKHRLFELRSTRLSPNAS